MIEKPPSTVSAVSLATKNQDYVERIRQIMSSKIGKSPGEPDMPHRNFIPR